jgi:hypothetical protein
MYNPMQHRGPHGHFGPGQVTAGRGSSPPAGGHLNQIDEHLSLMKDQYNHLETLRSNLSNEQAEAERTFRLALSGEQREFTEARADHLIDFKTDLEKALATAEAAGAGRPDHGLFSEDYKDRFKKMADTIDSGVVEGSERLLGGNVGNTEMVTFRNGEESFAHQALATLGRVAQWLEGKAPMPTTARALRIIEELQLNPSLESEVIAVMDRITNEQFGSNNYPTPFDISNIGNDTQAEVWLGMVILMGSSWNGIKWLT